MQLYLLCIVLSAEPGGQSLVGAAMEVKQQPNFQKQINIVGAREKGGGRGDRSGSESRSHSDLSE